jgi:peptide/nickel transport system permease protein
VIASATRIGLPALRGRSRPSTLALIGVALLALIVLAVALAPVLSSWGPTEIDFNAQLVGPGSPHHLLGTDRNGMDIFSRVLFAGRVDLEVAAAAVGIAILVGGALGAIVGYLGGWLDEIVMRVVDIFQSFPTLVLALTVAAVLGSGVTNMIEVIALVNAPAYVRLMRAEVRSVREHGYVEAARAAGATWPDILFRQIVPNSLRPVFVIGPLNCGWAILTLAALSFVGLGVQIPHAEWGAMISTGQDDLAAGQWWTSVFPGIALFLTVLALNLTSEGFQTDPRGRR